jgi:hypothetical protein
MGHRVREKRRELQQLRVDLLRGVFRIDRPVADGAALEDALGGRVAPDVGGHRPPHADVLEQLRRHLGVGLGLQEHERVGLARHAARLRARHQRGNVFDRADLLQPPQHVQVRDGGIRGRADERQAHAARRDCAARDQPLDRIEDRARMAPAVDLADVHEAPEAARRQRRGGSGAAAMFSAGSKPFQMKWSFPRACG